MSRPQPKLWENNQCGATKEPHIKHHHRITSWCVWDVRASIAWTLTVVQGRHCEFKCSQTVGERCGFRIQESRARMISDAYTMERWRSGRKRYRRASHKNRRRPRAINEMRVSEWGAHKRWVDAPAIRRGTPRQYVVQSQEVMLCGDGYDDDNVYGGTIAR